MTQVVDPFLGISRPDGEYPHRCSKCGVEIDEDAVPLMLWNGTGELMWVYCDEHMDEIAARALLKPGNDP
jgi:hypothetical protein